VASILYLEGAREFRDLAPRRWPAYAGGVVAIGAVAYFYYIVPSMNERAAVMSAFLGVILALVSITLLRGIPREHRFGQTFTGWTFALCAATSAARAFYCHFGPPMSYGNTLTGLYGLFFITTVSEMAAFSTGLAVMADEQVISDLHNVKERVSAADAEVVRHIEAEGALRESEERFRRVFEEGPLGLGLVGKDYRFLKVNSALCQMVGYPGRELVQMSFPDITHPDDLQADVVLAEKLFRSEIPYYRMQKRYVKKNGEVIWINLTGLPQLICFVRLVPTLT
jgi:PAS domain S-box-containing protein